MASTSASRNSAAYGRISSAASTLCSDNQTLIAETRKATMMMKEIAVCFEEENNSDLITGIVNVSLFNEYLSEFQAHPSKFKEKKYSWTVMAEVALYYGNMLVKELEDGVLQLVKASDECTHLSNAIQSIGNEYQPGAELTNFSKLFDDKIERLKAGSSSVLENHLWLRQFREAVWNVHHAGQPMPGEEQEDIIMTSTESNLLNITCPLTGKPVTELADPVRSMDCKHIYEKKPIMQHIRSKNSQGRCPVSGCPKRLQADRVVCDPLLRIEIDELRALNKQRSRADLIEDFTQFDEED